MGAAWLIGHRVAVPADSPDATGDGEERVTISAIYWNALQKTETETGRPSSYRFYKKLDTSCFRNPRQVYEAAQWVHQHGWIDDTTTTSLLLMSFLEGEPLLQNLADGIRADNPVLPPPIGEDTPVPSFKEVELITYFALAKARCDTARTLAASKPLPLDKDLEMGIDILQYGRDHQCHNATLIHYLTGAVVERYAEDFMLRTIAKGRLTPEGRRKAIHRIVEIEKGRSPMIQGWCEDMAITRDYLLERTSEDDFKAAFAQQLAGRGDPSESGKVAEDVRGIPSAAAHGDDATSKCIADYMNNYIHGGKNYATLSPRQRFEYDLKIDQSQSKSDTGEKSRPDCMEKYPNVAIPSLSEPLRREDLVVTKLRLCVTALALQDPAADGTTSPTEALNALSLDPTWGIDPYNEKEFTVERVGPDSLRLAAMSPPWYDDSYREFDPAESLELLIPLPAPRQSRQGQGEQGTGK